MVPGSDGLNFSTGSFYATGAVPERMGLVIQIAGASPGKDIVVAVVLSKP